MKALIQVDFRIKINTILMLISMCIGNSLAGNSINVENIDIRYNWAKSGLNIREEPNINSKVIEIIPFAEELEILFDSIAKDFSVEITEVFSIENCVHQSGLYIEGGWVKIKYKLIVGYVFDGFLSKFPPLEYVLDESGNKYVEELNNYLDRNFKAQSTQETRYPDSDYYKKITLFKNGIIYESTGSTGWYDRIIIVPNMSMKEGILLFLAIADSEQVRKLEEGQKYQIYQQEHDEIEINAFGEIFKIHQFGSTLVFTKSGSC